MEEIPWGVDEERAGKRVVMMEKLAMLARRIIAGEGNLDAATDRQQSRALLFTWAIGLGFSPNEEASAAVDEALSKAGTTP